MTCKICSIGNKEVQEAIEKTLRENNGTLYGGDIDTLKKQFPAFAEKIEAISDQDCLMHLNFHMCASRFSIARSANLSDLDNCSGASTCDSEKKDGASLAEDIGKDEAEVLYELLNAQMATFNALSNKINKTLVAHDGEMNVLLIHPETAKLYNEIASSMRDTVTELRNLDDSKNGEKGSSNALVELVKALRGSPTPGSTDCGDMTTKEFDD